MKIISGVEWHPLKTIQDERGAVLHMVRSDAIKVNGFGEIYFSELNIGITKGWKMHMRMTQRLAVPFGVVQFTMHDARINSVTSGTTLNRMLGRPNHYGLLVIPPGIWYKFKNIGDSVAIVANCSDLIHDPSESRSLPLDSNEIKLELE
jgi:dTDP-4-dehydrorhamnose 3,5-epimerase